jgi:ribosome-binding factor A
MYYVFLIRIVSEGDIRAMFYPDDDLLRATTLSEVDVSADLSTANVYISVLGNSVEKRQVFVWLCENIGQVRYEVREYHF